MARGGEAKVCSYWDDGVLPGRMRPSPRQDPRLLASTSSHQRNDPQEQPQSPSYLANSSCSEAQARLTVTELKIRVQRNGAWVSNSLVDLSLQWGIILLNWDKKETHLYFGKPWKVSPASLYHSSHHLSEPRRNGNSSVMKTNEKKWNTLPCCGRPLNLADVLEWLYADVGFLASLEWIQGWSRTVLLRFVFLGQRPTMDFSIN